jgi:hypothetical protein
MTMATADIPGFPTGDPSIWPTPPCGGTWRQVEERLDGTFAGFALDTPAGTGYVGHDPAGGWFADSTGPEAATSHPTGDEAIAALVTQLAAVSAETIRRRLSLSRVATLARSLGYVVTETDCRDINGTVSLDCSLALGHTVIEVLFRADPDTGYLRFWQGFEHGNKGGGDKYRTWKQTADLLNYHAAHLAEISR